MTKARIQRVRDKNGNRVVAINSGTDVADCERLIEDLAALEGPTRIKVATDWPLDAKPGGAVAGMQAMATWARSQQTPHLVLHATADNVSEVLESFCKRPQAVYAIMLAAKVTLADGTTDVTRLAWDHVRSRALAMDRMDFGNLSRGQAISLVCVDQSSLADLTPLYSRSNGTSQVRDASEFGALVEEVMLEVSPRHGRKIREVSNDLGIILHELFSNAHHHGRMDAEGKLYKRSVRSVTFAERAVPRSKSPEDVTPSKDAGGPSGSRDDWTDMREYLGKVANLSRSKHNLRLFEMSIVDSGPGMAAHAARAAGEQFEPDVVLGSEQAWVQGCFAKNASRRMRSGFGMGLSRVMQVAKDRGGLVRVRTGRLALTKFFDPATSRPGSAPTDDEARLVDAPTMSPDATRLGRVAGTAVTVLVPVGLRS